MKSVAGSMKLDLAQYREIAGFAKFGSDIDEATQNLLDRGDTLTELLKQSNFQPLEISNQIISIASGVLGLLDQVELEDLDKYQADLYKIFYNYKFYDPFRELIKNSDPREVVTFLNWHKSVSVPNEIFILDPLIYEFSKIKFLYCIERMFSAHHQGESIRMFRIRSKFQRRRIELNYWNKWDSISRAKNPVNNIFAGKQKKLSRRYYAVLNIDYEHHGDKHYFEKAFMFMKHPFKLNLRVIRNTHKMFVRFPVTII